MRGSREAVARVPKPIRNSRRLRAPRRELRFFKTLCTTYILLRLLRCAEADPNSESSLRPVPAGLTIGSKIRTAGAPKFPEGNCFQHCRPSSLSTKAGRLKIMHTIALRRTGTRIGFLLVLSKARLGVKKQFSTTLAPKTSELKGNSIETRPGLDENEVCSSHRRVILS
jgi:hypothetical protein